MREIKPKGFSVAMYAEVSVLFSDAQKAKAYFIDGNWKNIFWELSDMEELASNIAHSVFDTPGFYDRSKDVVVRNVEGYGAYVREAKNTFVAKWEGFGIITVIITDELEPSSCCENPELLEVKS